MKKAFFLLVLFTLVSPGGLRAAVQGSTVEYKDGDAVLEGYVAYDDAIQGVRPVVLVVHEWKGLNDYAQRRADMLAGLGYLAFAVDMYGKGLRARDHQEAAKLSGVYRENRSLMRARASAALDFIRTNERADISRVAAIGYCFGGTTVLEMARAGFDLAGVASFHGALSAPVPAEKGAVKAKVLVFHGAMDKFIPAEEVEAFKKEMTEAEADWEFVMFSKTVHSFTVAEAGDKPETGMAYNAVADHRSWDTLKLFL